MSHSSGIPVSAKLRNSFTPEKRLIKVQITEDELVPVDSSLPSAQKWEDDLALIEKHLEADQPCYILFNQNPGSPDRWILFCYVPDKSKVKDKMVYASTRANLKQGLGGSVFIDDVFGTVPADFSAKGYSLHVVSKKTDAPLTESEQIRASELEQGPIYTGGSTTYVHGIAFPVEAAVTAAVKKLLAGEHNYVQLAVNVQHERITLDQVGNVQFEDLKAKVSTTEPRFIFYAYTHTFENSTITSYLYIFSCPDGSKGTTSAPVKLRMVYSSSKANVSEILTQAGGQIAVRLEINAGEDLVEQEVFNTIHPPAVQKKEAFKKPQRPGRRT